MRGDGEAMRFGKSCCVGRSGPNVLAAKVFCRMASVVVVRVSCSLGAMVPATLKRKSRGREARASIGGVKVMGSVRSRIIG